MGRPIQFEDEIFYEVFEELARGRSLSSICKNERYPDIVTVLRRVGKDANLRQRYIHARELQAQVLCDECVDIADNVDHPNNDSYVDPAGELRQNHEWVQRSKIRVETRKWLIGVLSPKKYKPHFDFSEEEIAANKSADLLIKKMMNGDISAESAKIALDALGTNLKIEKVEEMEKKLKELEEKMLTNK